jgi:hypothetical protein
MPLTPKQDAFEVSRTNARFCRLPNIALISIPLKAFQPVPVAPSTPPKLLLPEHVEEGQQREEG